MIITPMLSCHVPAVAALEQASFSTPWSEKSIGEELNNEWAIWYVALEEETLLGYIGVQFGLDGGDIMTIATAPEARNRGLGQKLVETILDIFREKDLGYLTLEVRPSNAPALRLYEKLGFQQVGRRKKYYREPTEDALLLTLYLKEDKPCRPYF